MKFLLPFSRVQTFGLLLSMVLALFVPASGTAAAGERLTGLIEITNVPVTGKVLDVNGDVRTWTNSSSSATILTNLAGINQTATNLYNQIAAFPYSGPLNLVWERTNAIRLTATAGGALAILTNDWAQITMSTNPRVSMAAVRVPISGEDYPQARTNVASQLLDGIDRYATNRFSTNATALLNYATLGTAQGISNKTWTASAFLGGTISWPTFIASNSILVNLVTTNATNYGLALSSPGTVSGAQQFAGGTATGTNALAIGPGASASGRGAIAIGAFSAAAGHSSTAFGIGAGALGSNSLAVGNNVEVTAPDSSAFGNFSGVTGTNSFLVGSGSTVAHNNSGAIGNGVATTADNQLRLMTAADTVSIPGVLAAAKITNAVTEGTNIFGGNISHPMYALTTLGNGVNFAVDLGTNYLVRLAGSITADSSIAGVAIPRDGLEYLIRNDTAYNVTLLHDTVDPTPSQRFDIGANVVIPQRGWVKIVFNINSQRWEVAWNYPTTATATNAVATSGGSATNLTAHGITIVAGITNLSTNVVTSDATVTTVYSFTPEANYVYLVEATILAAEGTFAERAAYQVTGAFYNAGGTATLLGSLATPFPAAESAGASAWAATLDVSGATVRVRVTGAAATDIDWRANLRIHRQTNP